MPQPRPAQRRQGRRPPRLPALADDPIAEHLAAPPPRVPAGEDTHQRARRQLLNTPGQWVVLATRRPLSEATARRLARSWTSAKPSRLDPEATGTFQARPFTRDGTWHLAVTYQPAHPPPPEPTSTATE